jgi:hypothetical protein
MLGLTWLDDDDTIVPNAAKVQSPAPALDESATGVSFIWPRDTDLTREQIEVAVGDRAAAAPSPTPGAGRTVETAALNAPRPEELRVTSSEWRPGPTLVLGDGPTMPIRSLSNENYDRVWIAQGDHVEAMGVGDTPQEAAINYAAAVSELLTGERYGDAFDTKRQIRAQQAAGRGECGDGHEGVEWETWAR